ncbi:MAG: GyrI-like domain-containing protein [Pseudomonadota bacterium]
MFKMKKELTQKNKIKLIGLTTRTNNQNEMNPTTGKIGSMIGEFFGNQWNAKIANRKNPGITFCIYTEYASDEHGDYTYFIGEEVNDFDQVPEGMKTLVIPASDYQKFTTPAGKMPDIVIQAWQAIWKMTPEALGGKRAYQADFEVYDQRAQDPENSVVDIYIGVNQ